MVLRKGLIMLLTLFIVVSATFFLMKAVPGDPFSEEKALSTEIREALHAHYGLNAPWYEQYWRYLSGVARWDLGPSFKYQGRTVNQIINDGFPISATLGIEALLLAIGGGVFLGSLAALKQNHWQDRCALWLSGELHNKAPHTPLQ